MELSPLAGTRVIAAMSGGVDSSVMAALLKEAGADVVGVFMRNGVKHDVVNAGKPNKQGCCSIEDSRDAGAVAATIGVPFYALNFEQEFSRIISYFVDEYKRGRTPNPCVVCNNDLKFGHLLTYANDVGAPLVATGHYAQTRFERGRYRLFRARDSAKDQTYYLWGLNQSQLAMSCFPLGQMTKAEVREEGRRLGLCVAEKPESQEICFVPGNDYRALMQKAAPQAMVEGDIVNLSGKVLGRHQGTPGFTIGQRKGLGIGGGTPYFVREIDPIGHRVVVAERHELGCAAFTVTRPNLIAFEYDHSRLSAHPADSGATLAPDGQSFRAEVQIRYRHKPVPATVGLLADGSLLVETDQPEEAVTPGQACVFYHGDECLGGGWIDSTYDSTFNSSAPPTGLSPC